MSFPSFISQKPGEIPIFRTYLEKFSVLAYIPLKIGYFELGHDYDVTDFIFKFTAAQGGGNQPSWEGVLQKRLGKTRVNHFRHRKNWNTFFKSLFFLIIRKIHIWNNFRHSKITMAGDAVPYCTVGHSNRAAFPTVEFCHIGHVGRQLVWLDLGKLFLIHTADNSVILLVAP